MRQDIVADVLNEIMNAKRAGKSGIVLSRFSKLLVSIMDIMKKYGYIDFKLENSEINVDLKNVSECKAIKPRYTVDRKNIDKYVRRFLPARNFGYVIISTNKGLMTHEEAIENKIGGSLIAYFY